MQIVIRGHNLPGRMFRDAGVPIHNVHVGIQIRQDPSQLFPADAPSSQWQVEVRVDSIDGSFDFKGPAVHGRRGERFIYLTWGDVSAGGNFKMFRRLKLMLDQIDPTLIGDVLSTQRPLTASIDLTDGYGGPLCGRLKTSAASWAQADGSSGSGI